MLKLFFRALSFISCTLSTETLFPRVDTAEELIPNLEEEATMVGFVHQTLGVVEVMLEGGIHNWIVGTNAL